MSADNSLNREVSGGDVTFKDKFWKWDGRLSRKPFILRYLSVSLVSYILMELQLALFEEEEFSLILFLAIMAVCMLSGLSLSVRRLHDLNRSGWICLLFFVPILNVFLWYYLFCHKGTEGENQYGADPLA